MIREKHFHFTIQGGTVKSHGMCWIPEGKVRAVVQILHGMSEHIERYREFARFLAERGILVVGHDHLGHGGTAAAVKEFGYFAEKDGNALMIRNIRRVFQLAKERCPDVPYILFGHSMGSFLARQYLCLYGSELDGAVICGTGYQPMAVVRLGMAISRAEAALFGWHYRSYLLRLLSFGSYNTRFRPNRTLFDWLSRDEAVVDRYVRDTRCGFAFTVNGYYNMFLGMSKILRAEDLRRMPQDLPVLFISGEEDPVGGFGKGVRRVERMFREAGMKDVECRLYPEDRHELLNELDKEQVYEDVFQWMERRIFVPVSVV